MSCNNYSTTNATRLAGPVLLSRSMTTPALCSLLIPDPAVYYTHLARNRARVLDETLDVDDGGMSTVSGSTATA